MGVEQWELEGLQVSNATFSGQQIVHTAGCLVRGAHPWVSSISCVDGRVSGASCPISRLSISRCRRRGVYLRVSAVGCPVRIGPSQGVISTARLSISRHPSQCVHHERGSADRCSQPGILLEASPRERPN